MDEAVKAFIPLPLDPSDLSKLLKCNGTNLYAVAVLMDHIRSNTETLTKSKAVAQTTASLFDILSQISSIHSMEEDDGGIAFAQYSTLHAIVSLVRNHDSKSEVIQKKGLTGHTNMLVKLIGATDTKGTSYRPPNFLEGAQDSPYSHVPPLLVTSFRGCKGHDCCHADLHQVIFFQVFARNSVFHPRRLCIHRSCVSQILLL
jgi:hypothetical protein